jgi:23S rRNA (cytidine1920-2'-O)/16S rRNA (cytidine1409-2'-O)-methyltransferase
MSNRTRIDQLLVDKGLVGSRNKAQILIRLGNVLANDQVIDKPGTKVRTDVVIRIKGQASRFVSRGGDKLVAAIVHFEIDCNGTICADLGASTGGFTDCLLQHGAQKIYAVDVGYGQLAWKLRQDSRVVIMERTNARHLQSLPEQIDLIVGDLSFISLSKLIPTMQRITKPNALGILLIKPQFEVGPVGIKNGLVKSEALRSQAIQETIQHFVDSSITILGHIPSPIAGAKKGNIEELLVVRF